MKPEMTECDRKLVSQPSRSTPTSVYRHPARNATCAHGPRSCRAHGRKGVSRLVAACSLMCIAYACAVHLQTVLLDSRRRVEAKGLGPLITHPQSIDQHALASLGHKLDNLKRQKFICLAKQTYGQHAGCGDGECPAGWVQMRGVPGWRCGCRRPGCLALQGCWGPPARAAPPPLAGPPPAAAMSPPLGPLPAHKQHVCFAEPQA